MILFVNIIISLTFFLFLLTINVNAIENFDCPKKNLGETFDQAYERLNLSEEQIRYCKKDRLLNKDTIKKIAEDKKQFEEFMWIKDRALPILWILIAIIVGPIILIKIFRKK